MVSEVITEQEEQVQGSVAETAEVTQETPTTETTEETFDAKAFWGEEGGSTEEPTAGEATVDDPLAGLTPEQLLERGAEQERLRQQQSRETTDSAARIQGTRDALNNSKATIRNLLTNEGIDAETALRLTPLLEQKLDEFHGSHLKLREADYREGVNYGADFIQKGIKAGGEALLGDKEFSQLHESMSGKSWPDFFKALTEAAAKKQGYASPEVLKREYTSRKGVEERLKKLDAALRSHGLTLAGLTGNGGSDLPRPTGSTARAGTVEWANEVSIEEAIADRARRAAV